jgi:Protein of unknown function (DUF2516)
MTGLLAINGILAIGGLLQILVLIAVVAETLGFLDALTHKPEAYVAAGKQTKLFWTLLLGLAALISFLTRAVLGIVGIIGVVAIIVYFVDVRPALRTVRGGGRNDRHMGPYGPW